MLETDPRPARHKATRLRILEAAWTLARRDGLAALSLREVARAVGMRAPSLYTYFGSKHDLYDAMFAQAVAAMRDGTMARPVGATPEETLRNRFRAFLEVAAADPTAWELVVQRPIPGFEPSAESFAVAIETFSGVIADLAGVGITDERAADMWRALTTGLMTQQISNEPGGQRWLRLADEAVDMFLAHFADGKSNRRRGKR